MKIRRLDGLGGTVDNNICFAEEVVQSARYI
jgi:hypothetical protein